MKQGSLIFILVIFRIEAIEKLLFRYFNSNTYNSTAKIERKIVRKLRRHEKDHYVAYTDEPG